MTAKNALTKEVGKEQQLSGRFLHSEAIVTEEGHHDRENGA